MNQPEVVSNEAWHTAREALLDEEKELTKAIDALAAKRRRLPMTEIANNFEFDTPLGKKSILELFDGQKQLVVYQFMDLGPDKYCPGCTNYTNNVPEHGPALLAKRGVTYVHVSNMPLAQIEDYKKKMGWTLPFFSSHGNGFAAACDAPYFKLTAFLRDDQKVYRTWNTQGRGVDRLLFTHNILDLLAYGREEEWEDSPKGWPQHPTYGL